MRTYRGSGFRVLYEVIRDAEPHPKSSIGDGDDVVLHFRILQGLGLVPTMREATGAVLLDARHRSIGFHPISVGTLNSSLVHPREVFRMAISVGAKALILAHNHPSGDSTPSDEDRRMTERITKAGEILAIELIDHVVIGEKSYFSFVEARHRPIPKRDEPSE